MQSLRVLVAEDRGMVASRVAVQLEGLGHWVVGVVKDGAAAAEAAKQTQPDLVMLGLNLPPADGIEATRAIFSQSPVPTILLTGYVGADLVRRGQDAGVLAYLVWPADASALASVIRVAVTRFRELRLLAERLGDTQQALRVSLIVERAKRLVIRRLDLSEAEAFQYLRRQSELTAKSIGEIAANLLTAGELLFGKPDILQCFSMILDVLGRREVMGPSRVV